MDSNYANMDKSLEEPLFDDHLRDLLKNAERRLQLKSQEPNPIQSTDNRDSMTLFDPESRLVKRPYVVVESGVARTQLATIADQGQPSTKSLIRRVEDPVAADQRERRVCARRPKYSSRL